MSMLAIKDIYDDIVSIAPAAIKTSTVTGTGVDLANVVENMVSIRSGVITDGTHTPKLQESTDNSTYTDVAAADQVGTLAAIASSATQQVAYIGSKRYIRVVVTVTGSPSTGGYYAASVFVKYRKQP